MRTLSTLLIFGMIMAFGPITLSLIEATADQLIDWLDNTP
jgi:hypothetical protein